jgi:hypothetical protein
MAGARRGSGAGCQDLGCSPNAAFTLAVHSCETSFATSAASSRSYSQTYCLRIRPQPTRQPGLCKSLFADRCGATAQVVCDRVRAPSRLVMAAHPPSSFSSVYDMLASSVSFIALTATDGLNLYVACSADESASAPYGPAGGAWVAGPLLLRGLQAECVLVDLDRFHAARVRVRHTRRGQRAWRRSETFSS